MKLRTAVLVLVPLALLTFSFATPSAQEGGEKSVLTGKMREINGILRKVGKSIDDEASAESNASAVLRLQQLAIEAKMETPMLIEAMTGEDKAEALVGYRMQINVLLRGTLDLEDALLQGEPKKAAKALRVLDEAKGEGHGEYKGRSR